MKGKSIARRLRLLCMSREQLMARVELLEKEAARAAAPATPPAPVAAPAAMRESLLKWLTRPLSPGTPAGYKMSHPSGGDVGFSWKRNNPLFPKPWVATPLYERAEVRDAAAARRAAFSQAAQICEEMGEHWGGYRDTALLNGNIELSMAASGEVRAADFLAEQFRLMATDKEIA